MSECLPDLPRYIRQRDNEWQGADHPDGPWRPIPAPQSGLPWPADGPAVPESREPAAVVEEPSDQDLYDYWISTSPELGCADPVGFARAILARWGHQPAPAVETDAILTLAAIIREVDGNHSLGAAALAEAILSHRDNRWGHQPAPPAQRHPAPVPVGERLPGAGDCDAEGRAWFYSMRGDWVKVGLPIPHCYTHWLPAHALPLPAGEVE